MSIFIRGERDKIPERRASVVRLSFHSYGVFLSHHHLRPLPPPPEPKAFSFLTLTQMGSSLTGFNLDLFLL
ncbi:hypothetical protein RJT34_14375 [Clitoria ternatea]|uniref:Uncharacterized protein n=1 Tax=Clitoria ternatea TaxID=43366 RepID=A0AAN9PMU1_CLITE